MSESQGTFSEHWHLVAGLRVSLRSNVSAYRQYFRGEKWYVLHDPFNNRFVRVRPEGYDLVSRFGPNRTVEECWRDYISRYPENAPGQEDVVRLLGRLYAMNLLSAEVPPDSARLFERYKRRRQQEIRSSLLSILFVRVPVFDPDALLRRIAPLIRVVFNPAGAVVWAAAVVIALKLVADNAGAAAGRVMEVLSAPNLPLLYAALVVVKMLHEFGHAAACRRFGGQVHTMGVMLLVFTPLPYMDATSSWGFRSRRQRILVAAAGMLVEVFVAAVAAVYWAFTGGDVMHNLAYNIMFVASVSTIVFNANPLLRFDGYYILSDLLDIPNLHGRARQHLKHLAEGPVFGCKHSSSPAKDRGEALELTGFGILSWVYRMLVLAGIVLFVSTKFLLLGLLLALVGLVTWAVVPVVRLFGYLLFDPQLSRCRRRALAISAAAVLLVVTGVGFVPVRRQVAASGVVEAVPYVEVVTPVAGIVEGVTVPSGSQVHMGTPLIKLNNPELSLEITAAQAKVEQMQALEQQALAGAVADLQPVRMHLASVQDQVNQLRRDRRHLSVKARAGGLWVSPESDTLAGRWLERGTKIGSIIGDRGFRFSAVVPQAEAALLFDETVSRAHVRLWGQAGHSIGVHKVRLIPFQQKRLPSAALSRRHFGDEQGEYSDEAVEPFFLVHAYLNKATEALALHGRSGKIRFCLPQCPLAVQWSRRVFQLLQTRYRL